MMTLKVKAVERLVKFNKEEDGADENFRWSLMHA
jgi:hypothetical protein